MPLTAKGEEIYANLLKEYGSEKKAKQVLYAGKNKGTFTGIDDNSLDSRMDEAACRIDDLSDRLDALCGRHDEAPRQFSTTDLIRLATQIQSQIAMRTK